MGGDRRNHDASVIGGRVGEMRATLRWFALAISVSGPIAAVYSETLVGSDRLWPISWLAWGPVGFFILHKRPRNGVGATLLYIGASMGFSFLSLGLAELTIAEGMIVWLELTNVVAGVLPWLGIIWLVLVYPTGSFAGRPERLVGRSVVAFGLLAILAFLFDSTPLELSGEPSPLALPAIAPVTQLVTHDGGFLVIPALLLAAIVLMFRRWRRSAGLERAQFRWLFFGGTFFLIVLVMGQFLPEDSPSLFLWLPAGFAIPVTIGIAITRYRLYDIDRVISRTVTYTVVVGLIAGAVALLAALVSTRFQSPMVVAATTLGVAAAFNPLRRRVQRWVDRRFNRSKYDAELIMDVFAGTLRDRTDENQVVEGWVDVVAETMQPSAMGVWMRR